MEFAALARGNIAERMKDVLLWWKSLIQTICTVRGHFELYETYRRWIGREQYEEWNSETADLDSEKILVYEV